MSPSIQATIPSTSMKPKKKKVVKAGKTSNSVTFPVDFFEHCVSMNDVEIGGNDLLQIYNQSQLKHRLNTTGLYVACNKPLGFSIEVTNNDSNMVMTGLRVLVGSQDVQRCPSFVEVNNKFMVTSREKILNYININVVGLWKNNFYIRYTKQVVRYTFFEGRKSTGRQEIDDTVRSFSGPRNCHYGRQH